MRMYRFMRTSVCLVFCRMLVLLKMIYRMFLGIRKDRIGTRVVNIITKAHLSQPKIVHPMGPFTFGMSIAGIRHVDSWGAESYEHWSNNGFYCANINCDITAFRDVGVVWIVRESIKWRKWVLLLLLVIINSIVRVSSTAVKRKTPSELRLKRKNIIQLVDESQGPVCSTSSEEICGIKKSHLLPKNTRYIDTRLNEVFPVRKSSIRLKLLPRKENIEENIPSEHVDSVKKIHVPSDLAAYSRPQKTHPQDLLASTSVAKDNMEKDAQSTSGKSSEITFCSVTELSMGSGKLPGLSAVDMDKAFKGLVQEPPMISASTVEAFGRTSDYTSKKFCSEFHIPGRKIPLDVTLKTTMRVVLSSSVNRFHRSITCGAFSNTNQIKPQIGSAGDHNLSSVTNIPTHMSSFKSVHSWVYPQSSLPPPVISALALAGKEGGQMDFMCKRQIAWEDSFRTLYYMLRTNVCNIFYVCTAQFVVVFTGAKFLKEGKVVCNANISQSTRSLRSLLKEHDICFSMPLSHSKVEQVTTEDLAELSEIERHNLGQTRRLGSLSDEDNSPQSLLAIRGNKSVHGLYDFLLNYRFVMTSMTGVDVPMLYAPVPFENAALSAPEVRCKEVRRPDHVSVPVEKKMSGELNQSSASGFCYSIEIKDLYIPPWIISSICNCLDSDESSYDISFLTEPTSTALNVGLEAVSCKYNPEAKEGLQETSFTFANDFNFFLF